MSRIVGAFIAYKIIKQLATKWEKWDAYKLGLIDKTGKTLKKAETPEEKKAMDFSIRMVKNIKKLIEKIPFGKTRLGTLAAALFMLKEELGVINDDNYETEIQKYINIPNDMISEGSESSSLLSGKYVNIETNAMYHLQEDQEPSTIYMNVPLYELMDLVTRKRIIVSEDDIRRV